MMYSGAVAGSVALIAGVRKSLNLVFAWPILHKRSFQVVECISEGELSDYRQETFKIKLYE